MPPKKYPKGEQHEDNIGISSNIFNKMKALPYDKYNNKIPMIVPVEGFNKIDKCNKPLSYMDRFTSNFQTLLKQFGNNPNNRKKSNLTFSEALTRQDVFLDDEEDNKLINQQFLPFVYKVRDLYLSKQISSYELARQIDQNIKLVLELKQKQVDEFYEGIKLRVRQKHTRDRDHHNEEYVKHVNNNRKLFPKLKSISEHILNMGGQDPFQRQEKPLELPGAVQFDQLKEHKIEQPHDVEALNTKVRDILKKKTQEFKIMKQIHGQDFLSDPSILKDLSESARSGDTSMASDMVSKYQEDKNKQKQDLDDAQIQKFFDLKKLSHKWGIKDDATLQNMIRKVLFMSTLHEAYRLRIRAMREEIELHDQMKQTDPNLAQMIDQEIQRQKRRAQQKNEEKKQAERAEKAQMEADLLKEKMRSEFNKTRLPKNKEFIEFLDTATTYHSKGESFSQTQKYTELFDAQVNQTNNTLQKSLND